MKNTFLKAAPIIFLSFLCLSTAAAQNSKKSVRNTKPATSRRIDTVGLAEANRWADTQMGKMSLKEKVGQLMFVRVPSQMNKKKQREFEKCFSHYNVGGVCFFKGTAKRQLELTRRYQQMSDIPLLVTIDGEWGLGMRLTDCYSFPRQMMMGALSPVNDTLIARFGEEVAIQCNKMGIHINFAPVCDINSNPRNPVIGSRSFGENKVRVARKATIYAQAMQRKGVIAVGKHFPGHGDTDVDSHLDMPVINHPRHYIDSVDLYPFRRLVNDGIRAMMVAHLQISAIDNRPNMPSSLSELIITPLLRNDMHFDGLVFTDGIDMKAVAKNYKDGEGAIRAIRAGSDVILLPIDVEKTIDAIVKEARKDSDFEAAVNDRCHRVLREKYRCGLTRQDIGVLSVPSKEDNQRCARITQQIAQKALTLVRNEQQTLPFDKDVKPVAIAIGNSDTATTALDDALRARIAAAGAVVVSLFGNVGSANSYGVKPETLTLLGNITAMEGVRTVLVVYGSPYILELLTPTAKDMQQPSAIVLAYQNIQEAVDAVTPALYGDAPFEGVLPVSTGGYHEGTSLKASRVKKISPYDAVREAGMDVKCFETIDSIARAGITQKAYPGCQVLVARNGKVVFNQCYGRQTYDAVAKPMDTNTVYDIASLTKVSATNLAVMKLVDAGKVSLDDRLSKYLPYLKHTDKKNITIRQVLSHYARLKAFDAYWKDATKDGSVSVGGAMPDGYVAIGNKYYIKSDYRDNILKQIAKSPLEKKQRYLYSDLGFILLADLVERVSGQSLDIFMQQQFYGPMRMRSTYFQPLQHGVNINRIAPTENDKDFRNQLLRGYVHDPNAAAMGGVAGHAGLFSTGNDLFRLYQMMLDSGRFEGREYISAKTFNTFNSRHYADKGNRRALGFDKPFISGRSTHVAPMASQQSFGHTGFTGTMVWVDPKYNIVYIFLSNRVYPTASPNKLSSLNIRTDIQKMIYKSIGVK